MFSPVTCRKFARARPLFSEKLTAGRPFSSIDRLGAAQISAGHGCDLADQVEHRAGLSTVRLRGAGDDFHVWRQLPVPALQQRFTARRRPGFDEFQLEERRVAG